MLSHVSLETRQLASLETSSERSGGRSALHAPLAPPGLSSAPRHGHEDRGTPRVLVIDCGSSRIRIGFAGDPSSMISIPSVVGRPDAQRRALGMRDSYVGEEALRKAALLEMTEPIQGGLIADEPSLEILLRAAVHDQLGQSADQLRRTPLMLVDRSLSPMHVRERLCQLAFEQLNVPSFYCTSSGSMALFSTGRTTGIVVDVGDTVTTVEVIYQGYVMPHATRRADLGGRVLTLYLARLLSTQSNASGVGLQSLRSPSIADLQCLHAIKEEHVRVAMDFDKALASAEEDKRSFEWKGQTLTMGRERFLVGEALFQPSLFGSEACGLHELVQQALEASDIDIRSLLLEHIVLTGGGSALVGLAERLAKWLETRFQCYSHPEVLTPPTPQDMVWDGAATTASLPATKGMFFTQAEYDELGPSGVHTKFFT